MANTTSGAIRTETPSTPPPTPKITIATIVPRATTPPSPSKPREQVPQRQQPTKPTSPPQSQSSPSSSSSSQAAQAQTHGARSLNTKTPWGCLIQTHPSSLAPKSLELIHTPVQGKCRCHGREEVIIKDYILRWVSWRIDKLKEHPVKATTWARASCEYLGLGGALDGILGRVETVFGDLAL